MSRWGMVIDLLKCVGCYGCQMACKAENATPPAILWARVEYQEVGKYPSTRRILLPLLCMHCREPECEKVCPSGATRKREDGVVEIVSDDCIGCRACIVACPYGARYFYEDSRGYFGDQLTPFEEVGYRKHQRGTTTKCDFCKQRIDEGLRRGLKVGVDIEATPACVLNCIAKARYFGDLDDPTSEVCQLISTGQAFQLRQELGTDPQVYYLTPGRLPSP